MNKIVPLKFADQLYEDIMAAIVNGKIPEGEKLPAETELAASFGVSRPVVREALSRLRADGVIVSRRGSGSYVQRKPSQQFLRLAPIGGIADLMRCFEFRIAIEGEAAALAAARRTEKDLAEMSAALKDLEDAIEHKMVGTDADIRFHNAIAAASKNKLFNMTLKTLAGAIFQGISVARKLTLQASTKRLLTVQTEHCRIFEAIRNEDANGARKAVRLHIENARARVLSDTAEPHPE
ncbi:MAG: FadR family transcriptional regulator [Burkholderiales bacterium]|nr:FadR family transcriptional regulator [Burkholderiales bacterium]